MQFERVLFQPLLDSVLSDLVFFLFYMLLIFCNLGLSVVYHFGNLAFRMCYWNWIWIWIWRDELVPRVFYSSGHFVWGNFRVFDHWCFAIFDSSCIKTFAEWMFWLTSWGWSIIHRSFLASTEINYRHGALIENAKIIAKAWLWDKVINYCECQEPGWFSSQPQITPGAFTY